MEVAIQVPAYREPDMAPVLESIVDQPAPDGVDVSYEAWVTPWTDPECGYCTTMEAARSVPEFSVHEAPDGKLSARNAAHDSSDADIIVSWDADAPPMHDGSFSSLISHFSDGGVVASNGWFKHDSDQRYHRAFNLAAYADLYLARPIYGRFSAFRAEAWDRVGPFDESVDQTSMIPMRREEEFRFRRKLEDLGSVVDDKSATVLSSDRRYNCWLEKVDPSIEGGEFCDREETF